jgi:hypothetical protein
VAVVFSSAACGVSDGSRAQSLNSGGLMADAGLGSGSGASNGGGSGAGSGTSSGASPGVGSDAASDVDSGVILAFYPASAPMGPCGAVVQQHPIEGLSHVADCSYVAYATLPPSSGDHYQYWAAYTTYTTPVPEGFWVHDLEHGAIVLTYNCAEAGCASDVAAAQQMIDTYPEDDAICQTPATGIRARLVMTPDPRLDVPFAASAWGWTLRANCFDPQAFLAFAQAHYGQGPEQLCRQGIDPSTDPNFTPTCGDPPP